VNEVRHSRKATSSISTPFQHKCPFQNPKNKVPFPLHEIKIQKEVGENQLKKPKKKKKMEYKQYTLEELQDMFEKE